MLFNAVSLAFPVVAVSAAAAVAIGTMRKTKNVRRSLLFNFSTVAVLTVLFTMLSLTASADTTAVQSAAQTAAASNNAGLGYIAAGLCTGLAGIGAGIALASGVPAAIGAVSEDPKAFGKSLIFVALGETIAIYGLVISVMILSNLG